MIGGMGPKFKLFLVYQPSVINQKPIKISLWYFLAKVCSAAIKNRKHHPLKLAGRIILLFNQVYKRELVSSLHNRGGNELEIFVITCTNI